MNKIFIAVLIIAAGTGMYFLIAKKKHASGETEVKKELIIGKWKAAPQPDDSTFSKYQYNFKPNGLLLRTMIDSVKADTNYYEWTKNDELVWKGTAKDSSGAIFHIDQLTNDSLSLKSKTITLSFSKLK